MNDEGEPAQPARRVTDDPIQPSPAQLILAEVRHIRELLEVIEAQARELAEDDG